MPVLSFGSLNIDYVYSVPHIVRPGETIAAETGGYAIHPGGKGLNQSLAMARAGLEVCHAGRVGSEGLWLKELLQDAGVNCHLIECCQQQNSGHAIIQVSAKEQGQNSIVVYGGANQSWTKAQIENLFHANLLGEPATKKTYEMTAATSSAVWQAVVCQNEMNGLETLLKCAYERSIPVIFNAAPYNKTLQKIDLSALHTLLVNEIEAMALSGAASIDAAFAQLKKRYPSLHLVMTLGAEGVLASYRSQDYRLAAFPTTLVDSTAAGDTFAGFYAAAILRDGDFAAALAQGSRAAALTVSRAGAAPSIPYLTELEGV